MKATLEFDLDDMGDAEKYKHCNKSIDYSIALWDIANIGSHFKHNDKEPTYDEVLKYINEIFENNNINIVAKIKQFNKEMIEFKKISSELDILKDLSFTERLQLALNYSKNYFEFSENNNTLAE